MYKNPVKRFKRRNYYFWILLFGWTVFIVILITFFARQTLFDYYEESKSMARAAYFRDLAYRAWCSSHGGVYVPITDKTQPNPYLVHPERDITSDTGKRLTLVNPAWMTSEVYQYHENRFLLKSNIISDCPINPNNLCDEWEAFGLSRLLEGEEEYSEVVDMDGSPYIRLIRPLYIDQSCLKCHAYQGYQLGDVRGGISILAPVDNVLARKYSVIKTASLGYVMIWLTGVFWIFYGWRKTSHYIAVRERTIQSLQKAKADAEDASTSKTQFLANMSHEIRTPMTAILGFSDMLYCNDGQDETTQTERNHYVGIIRNNARLLLDILNDLLDMTKVESGKVQLESLPVSPVQVCEEVASLMRVRTVGKSLELKMQYHFPLPETIVTDPSRLRQILVNLIGNAIKFTHEGSVTIDLTSQKRESRDFLDFNIIDTGIGVSEEQMEKIFQPFTQADASITRSFGGTGLGLVISQKFAQLLGGEIVVESTLGQGSIFTLRIPILKMQDTKWIHSTDDVSERRRGMIRQNDMIIPDLSEKRILLAEDGLDNQRLIRILLKKINVDVVIANNGKEAVELALRSLDEKRPFDLILMDMQMPIMDGCTAMKKLRQIGWYGQIVALTANAMTVDRERCMRAGADHYISKPVNARMFPQQIAALFQKSESLP